MAAERRDESGRKYSEHDRTVDWVFHQLIPQIEAEDTAQVDGTVVPLVPKPTSRPKTIRIGDAVYDAPPEAEA